MYSGLLGAFNPAQSPMSYAGLSQADLMPTYTPQEPGGLMAQLMNSPQKRLKASNPEQWQNLWDMLGARQTSQGFYNDMGPGSLYYQPWMDMQNRIQAAQQQVQQQAQQQGAALNNAILRATGPGLTNPAAVLAATRQPTGASKLAAARQLWPDMTTFY